MPDYPLTPKHNYKDVYNMVEPLYKKIVEKVKKDPLFIPIMARISIPFNLDNQEEEKENKLTLKEIRAKEHLEETVDITRHLSYNDINLLKKNTKEKGENNLNLDAIKKEQDERQK